MSEARGPSEEEFAEEIQSHLAHEADRLVAAGMAPADAYAAARRKFGNVTSAAERRHASARPAIDLSRLRLAVRRLARAPLFTFTVVTILGLAVATATLVFGAVYAVALRPLPFRDPAAVMQVWLADDVRLGLQSEDVLDDDVRRVWADNHATLGDFSAFQEIRLRPRSRMTGTFTAAAVDGKFFGTIGVDAALGRPITAGDDDAVAPPVIVLSDQLWRKAFGGDRSIVGTSWRLDATTYTIIGVAPPTLDIPGGEAWISAPGRATSHGSGSYQGIGRLKPGITTAAAEAQLGAALPRTVNEAPDAPRRGALVIPLAQSLRRISSTLALVIAAVTLLLAVAIANLGTLFLVRVLSRIKQTAISTALGATGGRLQVDSALEGLVVGGLAAIVGIGAATWARIGLQGFLSAQVTQRPGMLPLNAPVIGFAMLCGVAAGVVLAVLPQRIARRIDLAAYLHGGGAGSGVNQTQSRWRRALVALQVASTVIAAVAAVALLRSGQYMAHVDLGYDPRQVVVAPLDLASSEYRSDSAAHVLASRIESSLAALPGIGSPAVWASIGFAMPKSPGEVMMTAEGSALPMDSRHCHWSNCAFVVHPVSDNLFTTFGIALKAGRLFNALDRAGDAPVVILNERAAQSWWPGEEVVGKRLRIGSDASGQPWRTVVGVVANAAPLDGMGRLQRAIKTSNIQPLVYEPLAQADLIGPLPGGGELLVGVRAAGSPEPVKALLQRQLAAIAPDIEAPQSMSMEEWLQTDYTEAELRLHTLIAVAVMAVTLLLAILGVAGVVAESVRYRTRELGVRLALGATGASVVRLICASALRWLGSGVVAGVAATLLLHDTIARIVFVSSKSFPEGLLLFGPRHQTAVLIAAATGIVGVGLAAAYLPARAASRLDPLIALRSGAD